MDELSNAQEISLMSTGGRTIMSTLVDLVHMKLGDKAFREIAELPIRQSPEFFWRYLKFNWDTKADPAAQLNAVKFLLEQLPEHANLDKFKHVHGGKTEA
jgi:hypothetical protein